MEILCKITFVHVWCRLSILIWHVIIIKAFFLPWLFWYYSNLSHFFESIIYINNCLNSSENNNLIHLFQFLARCKNYNNLAAIWKLKELKVMSILFLYQNLKKSFRLSLLIKFLVWCFLPVTRTKMENNGVLIALTSSHITIRFMRK